MLHNYFKIALRNLQHNMRYSLINVIGLAIGITGGLFIFLWVWDEINFDRFHKNKEQLGQLYFNNFFSDNISTSAAVPLGPHEFLKSFDPRIKNTCVAYWQSNTLLTVGEKKVYQFGRMVSPEFLEMFQFPLLKGNAESALDDPRSIVLTESLAHAIFGEVDPINQLIKLNNEAEVKVTGVLKDLPANSSFTFQYLASWAIYGEQDWAKREKDNWDNESYPIFIELQPGSSFNEVNAAIKDLPNTKIKDGEFKIEMFIHPMEAWHLYSNFENGVASGGMIEFVRYFSLIALLVLIIACINFMNLTTARSEHRAREVGVRKTLGSRRRELVGQFIGESVLITAVAFILGMVMVEVLLPFYNGIVDKKLSIDYTYPMVWICAICIVVIIGFLAGSYPAFYLSSFNPVQVLKGKARASSGAATPRQLLVVLQFFFSITLIFGTIVIYKQIGYVKDRFTGYDKENLLNVEGNDDVSKNFDALRKLLVESRVVANVTSSNSPVTAIYGNNTMEWPGMPEGQATLFSRVSVGYDYAKTMGIKMLEGRDFSEDFKSDTSAMLINKAGLEAMGLENPIGAEVILWSRKWRIIGIIDNVVMDSPFKEVRPGFFILDTGYRSYITLRLSGDSKVDESIATLENIFKKVNPAYPFVYQFVDDEFNLKYKSITLISTLAVVFTGLALFITGLGLFGLVNFTVEQRTKEIGIRKVMGASSNSIVKLISKEFTKLMIVGFLLAAPCAWWGIDAYLSQYAYRTDIPWWILPVTGLVALVLTLAVVSTQALRAAAANPSKSLRSE
jgi:putative ABC transport system permease protein